MNEQDYNQLREQGWRRRLTEHEHAELQEYLATHPAAREEWQDETALNELLEILPAAPPVSSNFTARVLQVVQLETITIIRRERSFGWFPSRWLLSWLPKTAVAAVLIGSAFIAYHEQQEHARVALAQNVVEVTAAVSASDPDLMQDFEPIRQLSAQQTKADTELLALLK
jgi:hypothetical protein